MSVIKSTKHLSFHFMRYAMLPNTTLEEACSEAMSLAETMSIPVEFVFNGCLISIDKADSIQEKINFYNESLKNG
jgi:hypothetical protein